MNYSILEGDCVEQMRTLDAQSVQTCVTPPPYFGLRDYGHEGQIGLEDTPEAYVERLVEVFREVWRVLRDDGTLWLNIGDSYASYRDGKATPDTARGESNGTLVPKGSAKNRSAATFAGTGIKHKDLIGIPWQVAFALRADGRYLRSDVIWHKPNPMPESVTDRPTSAHEHIFLLTKSPRYYYDYKAIREPSTTKENRPAGIVRARDLDYKTKSSENPAAFMRPTGIKFGGNKYGDSTDPKHATKSGNEYVDNGFRNKRNVWTVASKPFKGAHFAVFPAALIEPCVLAGSLVGGLVLDPFAGSGTTGVVALRHDRNFVGCELNPEYAQMARDRIAGDQPLFNVEAA